MLWLGFNLNSIGGKFYMCYCVVYYLGREGRGAFQKVSSKLLWPSRIKWLPVKLAESSENTFAVVK